MEIIEKIWGFISHPIVYPIITSLIVAIGTSYLSHNLALKKFHREKQYDNKLKRYLQIVELMRGFVKGAENSKDRTDFVNCYRTIWLYGDRKVIQNLTAFLKIALNAKQHKDKQKAEDQMKEHLMQAVLDMRKDLKAMGSLKEGDIDIYV